jgi:hypothetical protein
VFRIRMEQLVTGPMLLELKKAFVYRLCEKNKIHFLQNFSQFDPHKTGKVPYNIVERIIHEKGRRLHAMILYNWMSKKYVSLTDAKNSEFEYQPIIDSIQRDVKLWTHMMQAYQNNLKQLLTVTLNKMDLSLYELYYINTLNSAGMLTRSKWNQILSLSQAKPPADIKLEWYFLSKEVNYLHLC